MAKRAGGEFDGTSVNDVGSDGTIDPASLIDGNGGGNGAGSGSGGSDDDFDPAIHVGRDKRNADGSYTRKRGRKGGGSGSRSSTSKGTPNLAGIEAVLLSMHHMAAAALQSPEMALDKEEAKAMSEAIAEVAKHYPMTIDPKTMAWINLASCAGMIYGPRAYMIANRKREEAKEKKRANAGPNNIAQFGSFDGMGSA